MGPAVSSGKRSKPFTRMVGLPGVPRSPNSCTDIFTNSSPASCDISERISCRISAGASPPGQPSEKSNWILFLDVAFTGSVVLAGDRPLCLAVFLYVVAGPDMLKIVLE